MQRHIPLSLFLLLFYLDSGASEIYKCTDAAGDVVFSDVYCGAGPVPIDFETLQVTNEIADYGKLTSEETRFLAERKKLKQQRKSKAVKQRNKRRLQRLAANKACEQARAKLAGYKNRNISVGFRWNLRMAIHDKCG